MTASHLVYNSDSRAHTTRDTEALWALMPALLKAGATPGDTFLGSAAHTLHLPHVEPHLSFSHLEASLAALRATPTERRDSAALKKLERLKGNYDALDRSQSEAWRFDSGYTELVTKGDLIVLTTRPPMEERRHAATHTVKPPRNVNKKAVVPAWTDLEDAVMATCSQVFRQIKRDEVSIRVSHETTAAYAGVDFRQYKKAGDHARAITADGVKQDYTIAYFTVLPLAGSKARLVLAFGMSGLATLAWSRSLALHWDEWGLDLSEDCFVMAKFWPSAQQSPPMRLSELNWKVELIANLRMTEGAWR